MNYLRISRRFFRTIFSRFERIPLQVHQNERISRFILARDHFNPTRSTVAVAAFMPPQAGLSVYRTLDCDEEKVWWLGERYVSRLRKDRKPVLARADVTADVIIKQSLEIKKLSIPHPRHANVIGWPSDKPAAKMKATVLANSAKLLSKPAN